MHACTVYLPGTVVTLRRYGRLLSDPSFAQRTQQRWVELRAAAGVLSDANVLRTFSKCVARRGVAWC